jgi:CheY-like chemotaxis protein
LGIGLSIVRHIVELHGGTVEAQSPGIGKGATFTVALPTINHSAQARSPRPAKETVENPSAPPARRNGHIKLTGKRILLVDDEADARELVCEILRRADADVSAVSSVREAFESMARDVPDVVVSDLGMPEQDGFSMIQTLRQMPPDRGGQTPAIALTAYAREEDRLRALSAGFQMHLTKPVEPERLLEAIAYLSDAPAACEPEAAQQSRGK